MVVLCESLFKALARVDGENRRDDQRGHGAASSTERSQGKRTVLEERDDVVFPHVIEESCDRILQLLENAGSSTEFADGAIPHVVGCREVVWRRRVVVRTPRIMGL